MENFNETNEKTEELVSLVKEGIKSFSFTAGKESSYDDFLNKLADKICDKSPDFEKDEVVLEIRRQMKLKGATSMKKNQMNKVVDDMKFNDIE